MAGYLDAFEPDYAVLTAEGLDKAVEGKLTPEHQVNLEAVLSPGREEAVALGVGAVEVYRNLYERTFQFIRRHPHRVARASSPSRAFDLFTAACCGGFPEHAALSHFSEQFSTAFEAEDIVLGPTTLFDCVVGKIATPLRIASAGLQRHGRGMQPEPVLFYMDARSTHDIIDLWNLRALGWNAVPVPKQWAPELVDSAKTFVARNDVPYRHNPAMRHWTTLIPSRSVPESEADAFRKTVAAVLPEGTQLMLQHWYPRLWDEWARDKDHALRSNIVAEEKRIEAAVENDSLSFASLSPDFADSAGWSGKPRWANTLSVTDYIYGSDRALVLPPGSPQVARLLAHDREKASISSEGIVLRCEHANSSHWLRLPDSYEVFRSWLSARGTRTELSDAGYVARHLLAKLGGVSQARWVAHPELVRLLDEMAHGLVEAPIQEDAPDGKPKARFRMASRQQWWALLLKVHSADARRAQAHLQHLTDAGVLRLGLRLSCPTCHQSNWFALGDISEEVQCERCLSRFAFPAADPPQDAWYYRTHGPFSIGEFAQGSYVVALALRFLTATLHAQTTWVPGLKMTPKSGKECEADFAMWWRRATFRDVGPQLIFGECKTFGAFGQKDKIRANRLAAQFPGATLVFATLREELSTDEVRWISTLARRGRRRLRAERWRNPVIVLSKHELVSEFGPPHCWEDAGGKYAEFAPRFRHIVDLNELSDATQQLHLGMESYAAWHEKDMEKLTRRLQRSGAQRSRRGKKK